MNVTETQIIARGLSNSCPNCGQHTLFPPRSLHVNPECPACGTRFERSEGFYLGPWVLNYTVAVFGFVLPAIGLAAGELISWSAGLALAGLGCTVMPLLLYRATWSWWLMLYFFFLPDELPANGSSIGAQGEE